VPAVLGHDERLHRDVELIGELLEEPHVDGVVHKGAQRPVLEGERHDAVPEREVLGADLHRLGVEDVALGAGRGRQTRGERQVLRQPVLGHEPHLEQRRVEAAAVDHLALVRLLHTLHADEPVAYEERAQA